MSDQTKNKSLQETKGGVTPPACGLAVNQTELAKIFGVSDVTIWEWQKLDGFPILQRNVRTERGQENLYDAAVVVKWKIEHEVKKVSGPESQRDRLIRAQAIKAERENDIAAGTLIPAAEIETAWVRIVAAVRQAFLTLGARLAPVLETTLGVDAKRALIDEEVYDALTKLSAYDGKSPAVPDTQGDGGPRTTEADSPSISN